MKIRCVVVIALVLYGLAFASAIVGMPQHSTQGNVIIPSEDRIDINHASVEQLIKVHGLTRIWAERIVRFRPYRTKLDLRDKGIITGEIYDKIQRYVIAHRDKQ